MRYLLDTCVLSDFVKGDVKTIQHITSCSPAELSISVLTVMEIEYGVLLVPGKKSIAIKEVITNLTQAIEIIPFTQDIAMEAALIRADLRKQGQPIGSYDLLIGATALYNGLTMITANVGEFKRINKLEVQNWREQDYVLQVVKFQITQYK